MTATAFNTFFKQGNLLFPFNALFVFQKRTKIELAKTKRIEV
jgi:hypothetical protein